MSTSVYLPDRGDIVWLVFDPKVGHEQAGRRPAIVLSRRLLAERTGFAFVCPITSRVHGLAYEIELVGTATRGVILPIQLKSVDLSARQAVYIEKAPEAIVQELQTRINVIVRE